jgi:hypothetical protein
MNEERFPEFKLTYVISRSGTRHIVGRPRGGLHSGRISTLCEFGIRPDDVLEIAARDCEFCLQELELIRRREEKQKVIAEEKLIEIDKLRAIPLTFDEAS